MIDIAAMISQHQLLRAHHKAILNAESILRAKIAAIQISRAFFSCEDLVEKSKHLKEAVLTHDTDSTLGHTDTISNMPATLSCSKSQHLALSGIADDLAEHAAKLQSQIHTLFTYLHTNGHITTTTTTTIPPPPTTTTVTKTTTTTYIKSIAPSNSHTTSATSPSLTIETTESRKTTKYATAKSKIITFNANYHRYPPVRHD